jgi:hypothetical protein
MAGWCLITFCGVKKFPTIFDMLTVEGEGLVQEQNRK